MLFTGRQDAGWISEEEVCLQTPLHLPLGSRYWLRSDRGGQPALIQQVYREANSKSEVTRAKWFSLSLSLQGYLFISVLISGNSELIQLIVQSIKNDLASRNPVHVSLALQCIANIGSKDMAEAFGQEIPKLLVSGYENQNRLGASLFLLFISGIHWMLWSSLQLCAYSDYSELMLQLFQVVSIYIALKYGLYFHCVAAGNSLSQHMLSWHE